MAKVAAPKKIKLTYFNGRGRAEATRMTLAYAGIAFEDVRIEFENWPAVKASTPFGSLPFVEVDGKTLGQSLAISRYAAKLAGIAGATPLEAARLDSVVDVLNDLREKWGGYQFAKDDEAKKAKKCDLDKAVPEVILQLEKLLGKDYYFGAAKLSYADLHLYAVAETYKISGIGEYFEKSKTLTALMKRVDDLPAIKKYLAQRKETKF